MSEIEGWGGTHTYQGLRKADISAKKCQEKGEEVPARCQECGCFKEPQRVVALAATLVRKGLTRPEALLLADKAADGLPRVALRGKTSKGVCAHAWSCVRNILPFYFTNFALIVHSFNQFSSNAVIAFGGSF